PGTYKESFTITQQNIQIQPYQTFAVLKSAKVVINGTGTISAKRSSITGISITNLTYNNASSIHKIDKTDIVSTLSITGTFTGGLELFDSLVPNFVISRSNSDFSSYIRSQGGDYGYVTQNSFFLTSFKIPNTIGF